MKDFLNRIFSLPHAPITIMVCVVVFIIILYVVVDFLR